MKRTGWQLLNAYPPAMIRLIARRKVRTKVVRGVSLQEIAIASGLPLTRVQAISQSVTWDGISIPEAERFCAGCNFDPLNVADRNRQAAYVRSCKNSPNKMRYQRQSPWWRSECIPLIEKLRLRVSAT